MTPHPLTLTACIMVLALPFGRPAQAADTTPIGEMTATIDAQTYQGQTLDVPSEGTATAEFRSFGPMKTVSVQAHDPAESSIMRGILVVEFSVMEAGGSPAPMTPSISWWPEGMNAAFFQSEEGGSAAVMLDTLNFAQEARATGRFTARLCRKDSFFAEADAEDCRSVEGRFDTALREGS